LAYGCHPSTNKKDNGEKDSIQYEQNDNNNGCGQYELIVHGVSFGIAFSD
jgi:hypothetical protein